MEQATRVSAFRRLASMPPLLDVDDIQRMLGMPRKGAILYANRWKRAGLLDPLGPNCGLWFNLVADPAGPATRRGEAVCKLLDRPAVVVGGRALYEGGWTTQRHHSLPLAVPVVQSCRTLPHLGHGIELLPRSVRWFCRLQAAATPGIEAELTVASPEMALADALLSAHRRTGAGSGHVMGWKVAPDEVEVDDEDSDPPKVCDALKALLATDEEAGELLEPFCWDAAAPTP